MDLVAVRRITATLARHGARARDRLFTTGEIARCEAADRPAESYAARFAAKEAFFKALGTGWGRGGAWAEVGVVAGPSGAPSMRLTGEAASRAAERGVRRIHVTLSHTDELAGAYVVLES